MGVYIKGMEMPLSCGYCQLKQFTLGIGDDCLVGAKETEYQKRPADCPLVPVPPHGDLVDRDALAEDGWVLTKQVMRMGGYAIHELPLKNPTIPVIIPAEEGE